MFYQMVFPGFGFDIAPEKEEELEALKPGFFPANMKTWELWGEHNQTLWLMMFTRLMNMGDMEQAWDYECPQGTPIKVDHSWNVLDEEGVNG